MRDEPDFESLVQDYSGALYRFALSLTQNDPDAGDLVQQTFYLWAAKGHQLQDISKVKSWLFTTLYREFIGRQRRLARFPHHELTEVELELPESPPALPEMLDAEVLLDCLNRLDPIFRGPVSLFYLQDLSYNEIAATLEIPIGTVKSRIARAIAQLQVMLTDRVRLEAGKERSSL